MNLGLEAFYDLESSSVISFLTFLIWALNFFCRIIFLCNVSGAKNSGITAINRNMPSSDCCIVIDTEMLKISEKSGNTKVNTRGTTPPTA